MAAVEHGQTRAGDRLGEPLAGRDGVAIPSKRPAATSVGTRSSAEAARRCRGGGGPPAGAAGREMGPRVRQGCDRRRGAGDRSASSGCARGSRVEQLHQPRGALVRPAARTARAGGRSGCPRRRWRCTPGPAARTRSPAASASSCATMPPKEMPTTLKRSQPSGRRAPARRRRNPPSSAARPNASRSDPGRGGRTRAARSGRLRATRTGLVLGAGRRRCRRSASTGGPSPAVS